MINVIDLAEEHSNIKEADDLLQFANKLDHSSTLELEIEWYMKRKQNWGVQEALKVVNFCKPFLSKVLLIMKSVHDIVTIAKISESNVSKATESNTTKDTNNYISVDNELVETSSKKQKTLNSFTPQTRNTTMAFLIMVRVLAIRTTWQWI